MIAQSRYLSESGGAHAIINVSRSLSSSACRRGGWSSCKTPSALTGLSPCERTPALASHRLVRHVWSKGWDSRESRPQPRFPAPRHRPLPHLLPLAITPPGEGRPCQPKDCPYPPDFTRLLLFGAPWSYPGHGLLGGNHSVVISRLFARQDIGQGAERLGSCSALCATAARMTRTRLCTARAPGKMWVKVSSSECLGAQPSSCGRNRTRGCSGSSTRRRAFFKVHVASCHFIHRTAARGPVMIRHGLKLG